MKLVLVSLNWFESNLSQMKPSGKTVKVKNIIIEEVRKDMDSQRTLLKNLSSDLKDQREELEVAKR